MSRIFNHNNVTVDRENVISLDIIHYPKPPEIEETDEENAEEDAAESVLTEDEAAEIAEGIIEKAHREAAEYKTATFDEVNAEVAALREAAQAETVEIKAAA
ncbi:hypothetical protein FACS1894188_12380 [Clostridia bacterium]|nr:hypothetical protein FACS1894188_12380 [Clostridia bacterium]